MIKNTRYTLTGTRLARLCGVSQGTVDRALHGRGEINEKTKEKILNIAEQYGFLRSDGKTDERTKGIIGVIVFDVVNEYFSNLIMHIESHCKEFGYAISVMFSLNDPQKEIENIEALYRMGVDGIIICPVGGGKNDEDMEIYKKYLLSLKIPVVTVGNPIEGINHVGIDDAAAMKEVTERAISQGYKRLIYPHPLEEAKEKNRYAMAQILRYESFLKTARELLFSEKNIISGALTDVSKVIENSSSTDAFICPSDIFALRILGKKGDKKFGIIGFDNISVIDTLSLKLDSVSYDIGLTAVKCLDIILNYNGETRKEIIPYSIISRGSL